MNTEAKTRSFRGTLLEIVIIVGVFAIISVYILRMFLAADHLQGEAVNTSKATVKTESLAEMWKGLQADSNEKAIEALTTLSNIKRMEEYDTSTATAYGILYSSSWEEVQSGGDFIMLILFDENEASLLQGTVSIYGLKTDESNSIVLDKSYSSLEVAVSLQ